jgi:sterol desaturase/sphingolipid hydroxylase (fatty acid hydroxylase superfamily)
LLEHRDRNYAPIFSLWDVIFGTYCHPGRNEYPPTGVHDEREVDGFLTAVALPFKEWSNMAARSRR